MSMILSGTRFLASWAAEEQVLEASSLCPASTWLWVRPLGRRKGLYKYCSAIATVEDSRGRFYYILDRKEFTKGT